MPRTQATVPTDLDRPYELSDRDLAFYRKNGFLRLKNVFDAGRIARSGAETTRKVDTRNTRHPPLAERSRLTRLAAEHMGTSGVRRPHDQSLYKASKGGFTPWHADQYYWPLASTASITAWVPLQATPLEMGPVAFAPGSQALDLGRDLGISDQSQSVIEKKLLAADLGQCEEPFDLGEVSFHSGWTFHRAGRNLTGRPREVMTMIYMDEEMRLAEPRNPNQQADWEAWCPGARVGERIESPINPVLWSRRTP
jgi:hypothetical protein